MRKALIFIIFITSSIVNASELKIITYSDESKNNEEYFFLRGTPKGNYIVRSWQFDMNKQWNGKGEPELTIGKAVAVAHSYYKDKNNLGIKEITFAPAFSKQGTIIWFYLVSFTKLPYKFGADSFQIVILSSGEVVEPFKPKLN